MPLPPLPQHPLRAAVAGEVHARPYESLGGPWRVSHIAMVTGELAPGTETALIGDLFKRFGRGAPAADTVYLSLDLGPFRLRWERHTEFSTWTFLVPGPVDASRPFDHPALERVPEDWLARLPGQLLVAMHVVVDPRPRTVEEIAGLFDGRILGSRVGGGSGAVFTDFLLGADGCGHALIVDEAMSPGLAGRTLQRVLEIETYRSMALLALSPAQATAPRLTAIEQGVTAAMAHLAEDDGDAGRDRRLLSRLTGLAAENERLLSGLSYRLSASRAYHAIVQRAVDDLREERLEGLQTVAEFLARRLAPAMRTCEYVGARMEALSKRLTRAGDMLRTRVDIGLNENNRDLLRSMNTRAELQLRLQETVEGLSVVAISYYLLGLVGYLAKGLKEAGLSPVKPEVAVLAALPVVLGLVFVGVRRLRKAVVHTDG
ncbi:DUF3422 family protein [Caenispirillum bisanense]|uniref:Uncharacterized membrane-anchored protein n=1 Tax=Caenispirillum bisanense TaxID=414052 RepID=A0A286GGK8_9PROT|nr:DUF3422 domain-containing protein [Caenispirillum bisanense]SOD94651.1 Uncharacterized membrane-anchored protein [Caenispirillum bisanense]